MRFTVTVDGERREFDNRLAAEAHLRRRLAQGGSHYRLVDTRTGTVLRSGEPQEQVGQRNPGAQPLTRS